MKLDVRGRLASSALISGIRTRKMLSKVTQGYLAFLINTPGHKMRLEDMSVVKEYPNVFPEELECLPPEREIVFVYLNSYLLMVTKQMDVTNIFCRAPFQK